MLSNSGSQGNSKEVWDRPASINSCWIRESIIITVASYNDMHDRSFSFWNPSTEFSRTDRNWGFSIIMQVSWASWHSVGCFFFDSVNFQFSVSML